MTHTPSAGHVKNLRGALSLYRVSAIITGVMLLLLCAEMIVKYGFGTELEAGGTNGFLALSPTGELTGLNVSTLILIVHGWLYVLYLFCGFRLWSAMKWPFLRFVIIALGGVVPFLSFFLESQLRRDVGGYLAAHEDGTVPKAAHANQLSGGEPGAAA
ncbi:MAG: hypothetical protein B5766_11045 [Candidatus Lumbricidophila eiseniae]|uniref:DUF3817 domain-containing protein n=1 Tax=Candidatus Lumbricidiphila eiseniae TaxID=1969409 RepID=A0A2A6FP60_9MICO|nr:MAG: hypothetical protein B5766_11045 [Candidatus Lumbricidophila eiseniae]